MMKDKESLNLIKRLVLLLFVLFLVKDVLIPGIFYILYFGSEEAISSYESAMVQYMCLIGVSMLYHMHMRGKKKKVESQREVLTLRRVVWLSLLAVVSFVSFQTFKKAFLTLNFWAAKDMEIIEYVRPSNTSTLLLLFVVYVIWSAIAEELFYRGVVYGELSCFGRGIAALVTSLLFSLAHNSAEQIIQTFFLSFILCFLYTHGNILECMLVHMIYNSFGILQSYVYLPEIGLNSLDVVHCTDLELFRTALLLMIMGFVFMIAIIYIIKKLVLAYELQEIDVV